MADRKSYLRNVLSQMPRLLAHLDRNPYSATYGCFDFHFWHDKVAGFANGHAQESMLVLSLIYGIDDPENPYYRQLKVRQWALAALEYWAKIQHRDGTVDEFYCNERQFGATAITLYAAARTFMIFDRELKGSARQAALKAISRSSNILSGYDETHILSNHQAQVLLALHYSGIVLGKSFKEEIEKRVRKILDNQSNDGWFREYSGADMGYLTTTISFISEYYSQSGDLRLKDPLKRSMDFASYFLYPDGFYGGIGSRNTAHCWTAGFEIMYKMHPEDFLIARSFCDCALVSIEEGRLLTPEKEDRYFSEQMYDYLSAYINCDASSVNKTHQRTEIGNSARRKAESFSGSIDDEIKIPFERRSFRKYFPECCILVSNEDGRYLVVNAGKGGIFRLYDKREAKLLSSDSGYVGRLTDGKVITSNASSRATFADDGSLNIKADFIYFSQKSQSVITSGGLNLMMYLFGRTAGISNFMKDRLIKMLITGTKKTGIVLNRKIDVVQGKISDMIQINGAAKLATLSVQGDFKSVFVAYSKYFDISELYSKDVLIDAAALDRLNRKKVSVIKRDISDKKMVVSSADVCH